MRRNTIALPALIILCATSADLHARTIVVEPDDYSPGTVLNDVAPGVSLWTITSDDLNATDGFDVTANDFSYFAPTGTMVFGHSNDQIFGPDRRLLMTFAEPVYQVSMDYFSGGGPFSGQTGVLEIYDADQNLLDLAMTAPIFPALNETLKLSGSISYAVAYGVGPMRLDNLQVAVPEPGSLATWGLALAAGAAIARKRTVSNGAHPVQRMRQKDQQPSKSLSQLWIRTAPLGIVSRLSCLAFRLSDYLRNIFRTIEY